MSWIGTPQGASDTGTVAGARPSGQAAGGPVPNHARVFAQRPAVLAAWQQLNGAVKAGMDARWYELATVAAAVRMRCSYCALAHGEVLAEQPWGPTRWWRWSATRGRPGCPPPSWPSSSSPTRWPLGPQR
ncbi:carboxymuconolactone decarboxylase family protein [Modestobacter lacusdianchii]